MARSEGYTNETDKQTEKVNTEADTDGLPSGAVQYQSKGTFLTIFLSLGVFLTMASDLVSLITAITE